MAKKETSSEPIDMTNKETSTEPLAMVLEVLNDMEEEIIVQLAAEEGNIQTVKSLMRTSRDKIMTFRTNEDRFEKCSS